MRYGYNIGSNGGRISGVEKKMAMTTTKYS
jgi:hypothetical protein